MARIRTIKPDFWTSAQVMELSRDARLAFIGLLNFCDDAGIHPASPKRLKAEVFPSDELSAGSVAELVREMISGGLVDEYAVDGESYWIVTGWHHQKIDQPTYKFPRPDGTVPVGAPKRRNRVAAVAPSPNASGLCAEHSPNVRGAFTPGREGKGEEKTTTTTSPSPVGNGDPAVAQLASNDPVAVVPEAGAVGERPFVLTEATDAQPVQKLPPCPVGEIVELYHRYMPRNPPVRVINKTRRRSLDARWREAAVMTCEPFGYETKTEGLAAWREYFEVCNRSAFLTNQTPPRPGHENWKADFDFLISEKGFARALENRYHGEAA